MAQRGVCTLNINRIERIDPQAGETEDNSASLVPVRMTDSPNRGDIDFDTVHDLGQAGLGADATGYRNEFLDLVRRAGKIASAGSAE